MTRSLAFVLLVLTVTSVAAGPARLEAAPPAEGFDGWALGGVILGEVDGDPCLLTLVHRPGTVGAVRAERTASISRGRCVGDAPDAEHEVIAPSGHVVTAIDTCTDAAGAVVGVRLVVAELTDAGLVRARTRPSWAATTCDRWRRRQACDAGHAVLSITTPASAALTGRLEVRCVPINPTGDST